MKKIMYMLLAVTLGISLAGCSQDKKTSSEEEVTKSEYTVTSIEKPDQVQNIRCLAFMNDGTLRIGGTDQRGEKQTVWDSKDNGETWTLAEEADQLPDMEQQEVFYKYSSYKKLYTADDAAIKFSEDNTVINLETKGSYIDSALSGEELYVLTETDSGTKQLWKYDLSSKEWESVENEDLMGNIKRAKGLGCLAIEPSGKNLYTEGEGIIQYNLEKDETSTFIKSEELNNYIDIIDEPITGLAVNEANTIICTRDASGKSSNLYLLAKKKAEDKADGKTDSKTTTKTTAKNENALEVYSLKDNSMIRNSLAFFRRTHTDISINYTVGYTGQDGFSVSDAIRKLNTEIMAGEGPDIIVLDNLPVEDYISKGILEPVTDIVEARKDELFYNMVEGCNLGGEIYSVPTTFRIPVIIGDSAIVSLSDMNEMVDQMEAEESPVLTAQNFPYSAIDMFATLDIVKDNGIDEDKLTDYYNNLLRMKDLSNVTDKIAGEADYSIEQAARIFPYGESNVPVDVSFGDAKAGVTHIAYGDSYIKLNSAKKQTGMAFDYLNKNSGYYYIPTEILGINSMSNAKDAARDFLTLYLSEEVQDTNSMGFSVNRNSMRNGIAVTAEPQYYSTSYKNMGDSSGLDLYTLSTDEFNELVQFAEKADTPAQMDAVVMEMAAEQADKILYEGVNVETAVKNVCDKMDLYLKE